MILSSDSISFLEQLTELRKALNGTYQFITKDKLKAIVKQPPEEMQRAWHEGGVGASMPCGHSTFTTSQKALRTLILRDIFGGFIM